MLSFQPGGQTEGEYAKHKLVRLSIAVKKTVKFLLDVHHPILQEVWSVQLGISPIDCRASSASSSLMSTHSSPPRQGFRSRTRLAQGARHHADPPSNPVPATNRQDKATRIAPGAGYNDDGELSAAWPMNLHFLFYLFCWSRRGAAIISWSMTTQGLATQKFLKDLKGAAAERSFKDLKRKGGEVCPVLRHEKTKAG